MKRSEPDANAFRLLGRGGEEMQTCQIQVVVCRVRGVALIPAGGRGVNMQTCLPCWFVCSTSGIPAPSASPASFWKHHND